MRNVICLILVIMGLCSSYLVCSTLITERGGLTFSFDEPNLTIIGNYTYYSVDILVSSTQENQRLGTGIVMIDYNTEAFGDHIHTNQNLILTPGTMISGGTFPSHGMIINDNQASRLAITFEYVLGIGNGSLLTTIPQHLCNLKLKVQSFGVHAGLSFNQVLMSDQQFQDDNHTGFTPVVCNDVENSLIPARPLNAYMSVINGSPTLSWQQVTGCSYIVYSTTDPIGNNWQMEAEGLTQPVWTCENPSQTRFFKVTAQGIPDAE